MISTPLLMNANLLAETNSAVSSSGSFAVVVVGVAGCGVLCATLAYAAYKMNQIKNPNALSIKDVAKTVEKAVTKAISKLKNTGKKPPVAKQTYSQSNMAQGRTALAILAENQKQK